MRALRRTSRCSCNGADRPTIPSGCRCARWSASPISSRPSPKRRFAWRDSRTAMRTSAARRAAASAYRRLGRNEEAVAELKQALALRFDDAEARGELVSLALDRGDLDGAVKLLGETLAVEPSTLYPRLRAAELLSENGRTEAADAAYAQALALAPDDPEAHEQLGRHRLRAQDDTGALAAFTP